MPTKHIDAAQWSAIETMTVELTQQTNAPVKEGDVLKEVIAAGLNALSVKGLGDRFAFQPRHSAVIMSKLDPSGTATMHLTAPTAAAAAALLEDSAGFIVCVYGKTNSGRSTFAQALYGELSAAQLLTVNLYDDAGAEAISQGWADYNDGKGAIIVLHAAGQMQALDGLYSTHRSVLVHEEGAEIALNAGSGTTLDTSLLRATMRNAPERMPVGKLKEDE
ncbi:hypothetical protein [Pantoea agglomerans]|uniref:hypothetical protein n=1 Tax=Enterobacter agglomerans TaxID=549 RepID=UPI00320A4B9E